MTRYVTALLVLLLPALLLAQTPDSTSGTGGARREARQAVEREARQTVQRERRAAVEKRQVEQVLRSRIQERFTERVATALELQDKQLTELRATNAKFAERRAELEHRSVELRSTLRRELRPGIAANEDTVDNVMKELTGLQLQRARIQQDEMDELSTFLTPVQRARYQVMQQRLRQLVEQAVARRAAQRGHSSRE